MKKKETIYKKPKEDETTKKLIDGTDIDFVNAMLEKSGEIENFAISKSTLANISTWALNGESDKEIREHLDLTKRQFGVLCSVCPTLILIMDRSRAMADLVIAGSLVQTAIGGKRLRKQQAVKVGVYAENECGQKVKVGEEIKIVWLEEELPPNPMLLKFLAENKLSEQFGERKGINEEKMQKFVDGLSERERALIEKAIEKSSGDIDGEN